MPLDVRKTFASWRELMTGVKLELSHLDPHGAEFLQRRRELVDALQMMDTVAGELIDQALASLMLRTAQLEEATVLLSARAAGLALAETPMVFASESEIGEIQSFTPRTDGLAPQPATFESAWQPETDRGFLQDMARPTDNVVLFTGVQRGRHDQGGAR